MLIAMAGLPGAVKSRLADDLGRALGWPVLGVDPAEHRRRLESRGRDLPVPMEPAWDSLAGRADRLASWTGERVRVDAMVDPARNLELVLSALGRTAR